MRPGAIKTQAPGAVDLQANTSAVVIGIGGGDDRPELVAVELTDTPQRRFDALLFGFQLSGIDQVLPGAAAAAADIGAWRGLAPWRGIDDMKQLGDRIAAA